MKIVYCISGMYKSGGIERVLAGKVNYLVDHGFEVTIITTDQADRADFFPIDPRVKRLDLGLNYDRFDELPTWRRYWETFRLRSRHRKLLEEALCREQATITISVLRQESSFLPNLKDGSKKVLEYHTSREAPKLMYPKEQTLRRFLGSLRITSFQRLASRYDKFITLTQAEVSSWTGLTNIEVIPNPLPFYPASLSPLHDNRLIAVGRLEYVKNFPELLELWARVAPAYPSWSLHLYGSGWMLEGLRQQAARLGIASQVVFEGAVSDMEGAYRSSSIYVMTSHFEGLPMVLLEAQAMGLPIVSYACPSGPKDIVNDGVDGFLIPPYEQETFLDRLRMLMEDEELRQRMGQAARLASKRYEVEPIMQRWIQLFNTLASR